MPKRRRTEPRVVSCGQIEHLFYTVGPSSAPRTGATDVATIPYAELHAHTNFSFLDGASPADDLVERAVELGL